MPSDVLILGGGPVGLTTALLLARHGLRVDVLEKRASPLTDPRAVSLDDEALRIWQACGVSDLIRDDWGAGEPGQVICTYADSAGRPFLRLHQRLSELGHPHAVAIHQGRIDSKLLAAVEQHPLIRLHLRRRIVAVDQDQHRVVVEAADEDGNRHAYSAAWAVACDGASGASRRLLGIESTEHHLARPWLVANCRDQGPPGHVNIRCSATGASVTMPMPHGYRRIELELDAADAGEWLGDEQQVRARLTQVWSGASTAPIVNAAVCRFKSSMACQWRKGRVFLAGDAAHVMPPFAGQGLCAGLRDAAGIAFRIAGVCQGWLNESVLDSYEVERRPHVERITRLTHRLGRLMTPRSSVEGAIVHNALRLAGRLPLVGARWLLRGPNIQPRLRRGFLVRSRGAGHYFPQPDVVTPDGRTRPLDELLGPRMTWVVLAAPGTLPCPIPIPLVQPTDSVLVEGRDFRDTRSVLRRAYGDAAAVLVRPDRFVYVCLPLDAPSAAERSEACSPEVIALREVPSVSA